MQVGDLVQLLFTHYTTKHLCGVVVGFDHASDGVLCFIDGESMWFRTNQVEVIGASR